jgi:excisionase family DNA binding protein
MSDRLSTQRCLSLQEKAAQLSVCEETVRRHAKELGGIKVGRLWRFPYDDLRLALPDSGKSKHNGEQQCLSREQEVNVGGFVSAGYAKALALPTTRKPRH